MPRFPMLCAMMFLQFFVWGSWYVTAGTFVPAMGWAQETTGWVYTVGPIAALITPLVLGLIVDRFFPSQLVLAALHLFGGVIMLKLPGLAASGDVAGFEWWLLAYMLCYMPTLGLTNTIAFTHIDKPEKQFPLARVFGTLGWIAAVTFVSKGLNADESDTMFVVAGYSSILMAVFSLTLPHTPPPLAGKQVSLGETLGLGALPLLKRPAFAVFLIASFLICIPLAGYYSFGNQYAGTLYKDPGFYMSFGQWAEVGFMLVMPLCFARLGVKWMLAAGMFAWVLRYGLWSLGAAAGPGAEPIAWMMLGGILLHGICYDFFFVTGQIYIDRQARPEIRGQAQSFLVLVTQGLGLGLGAQVMTKIVKSNESDTFTNWQQIWLLPCVFALTILIGFVLLFRNRGTDDNAAA